MPHDGDLPAVWVEFAVAVAPHALARQSGVRISLADVGSTGPVGTAPAWTSPSRSCNSTTASHANKAPSSPLGPWRNDRPSSMPPGHQPGSGPHRPDNLSAQHVLASIAATACGRL